MAVGLIVAAAGLAIDAFGQIKAGKAAKKAGKVNAYSIEKISEQNAQLIEQGTELNAEVMDFNEKALEYQAVDAVTRGKQVEDQFRQQLKGFMGTQRVGYAGQNVDLSSGSASEVIQDTAKQGEFDALTIRTNAAREAWGYKTEATNVRLQARNLRKLGGLQAENVRTVGKYNAQNAIQGGNLAASQANWGAASTIVGGAGTLLQRKYGYG
jgi:hypothetical protein